MDEWLTNFEYRIHPNVFTFLFGVAFTFVVVLTTEGMRSYKAATANRWMHGGRSVDLDLIPPLDKHPGTGGITGVRYH